MGVMILKSSEKVRGSASKSHKTCGAIMARAGLICVLGVLVTACASSYEDWEIAGQNQINPSVDFAADSRLAANLARSDRAALQTAFLSAMGQPGTETVRWSGDVSEGAIKPGDFLLGNVLPDPDELLPTRSDIVFNYKLETEQGDLVLLKNSNIRVGPSTEFAIAETLSAGTGVEGLGRVQGETWMLIAHQDRVRGYVFEPLLRKAPGAGLLELAGSPVKQPHLCREFEQSLDVRGQKDRWSGLACDFGDGWELAGRSGPAILGEAF